MSSSDSDYGSVTQRIEALVLAGVGLAIALRRTPCHCSYLGDGDVLKCERCVVLGSWDVVRDAELAAAKQVHDGGDGTN